MQWNQVTGAVTLSPLDMEIMTQCKMPIHEILRQERPNKDIPPLWSVLSYVLLQRQWSVAGVWEHYRFLKTLMQNVQKGYYRCQIPKANGRFRELHIPRFYLRQEQEFIMENILSALPVDRHAFAYRKGVRMKDCAEPHTKKDVLIHLDIRNFFGSVKEDMVYATLREETGYAKSLCRFLARMCCLHGSLPQGTVTSPMLSNIVFRKCDVALAELANKYQMEYSRYSDDLFFSTNQNVNVQAFIEEVTELLHSFGFRLNTEKTRVRRQQHRQTVLGLTVNDHIQVNREYRRKLLQEAYYLERFGRQCEGVVQMGDYLKYMRTLQGRLSYAVHMDPDNEKLQEALKNLSIRIKRYMHLLEYGLES